MDKRLYLSLLLPLALAGCGGSDGGGGGSKPTPKYNIDFASFYVYETERSSTSCAIYDEKIYYKDVDPSDPNYDPDAEPEIDYREWVLANSVRNTPLRVAIHSAEGEVLKTYAPIDSEWTTTGKLRIAKSKVPSDGYLTIYESSRRNSPTGDDFFFLDSVSVHKSLLSTNMRFSDFQPDRGQGSCITSGNNGPRLREVKQSIDDGTGGKAQVYALNTRNENFWSASNTEVEAEVDNNQFMAARYEYIDSDTPENVNDNIQKDKYRVLEAYRFIKRGDINNKILEMNEIADGSKDDFNFWQPPLNGLGTLDSAKLYINKGGEPLFWQVLPVDSTGQYGYAHEVGSRNYYINGEGILKDWGLEFTQQTRNVDTEIDYSTELSDIDTPIRTSSELVACNTSETGTCLRGYLSNGEENWDLQRSFLLLDEGRTQIRQVIYGKPSAMQPLLSFTGFNGVFNDSNLQKAKISLFSSNKRDAQEAYLSRNIDVRGIATSDSQASLNPDNDGMALLNTEYERKQAQTQLRVQPHKVISATN